jgi:ATP-dependent DNA helicase RecQ
VTIAEDAERLLARALGDAAQFRAGQLEAILELVERRRRVLLVQQTGWGKSVVYFIATRLLRNQGLGPTILISPLLALMRDQIRMAQDALGLRAVSIDSTNRADWDDSDRELAVDRVDMLLVSPERLANQRFQTSTLRVIPKGIGLLVVDEAHCISDWGHDFRPDYRRISRIARGLPLGVPVLATTATANERVIEDVEQQLGPGVSVIRGPLARQSLHLRVVRLEDQAERLAWLAEYVPGTPGSGIVYVLTVADALRVSAWLRQRGIDAAPYYGAVQNDERQRLEGALRENEIKVLVATVALGMGFDKPDLSFVVHFQRPGSAIAYYQQIGRAGRAVERADVILLSGREDDAIGDYFIATAFPPEEVLRRVLAVIETVDGAQLKDLEARINAGRGTIERALKLLEIDGAIVHEKSGWFRTVNPWEPDSQRVLAVTDRRIAEQRRMREYVDTSECLMMFLTRELGDPLSAPCGRCANCTGELVHADPDPALVQQATVFLRRAYRPIAARKVWPRGLTERTGPIPEQLRVREGRALAIYGDAGWGALVQAAKYAEHAFDDRLVEAMAEMIVDDLQPDPAPGWVTAVPSRRNPELVPGFAERLADRLGLPYRSALVKVRDTPPQKEMQNSVQQARNALEAFAAIEPEVSGEPVLLVDDMVDSRWTLTVCGSALRDAGSGPVYPVVLAQTTTGGGG